MQNTDRPVASRTSAPGRIGRDDLAAPASRGASLVLPGWVVTALITAAAAIWLLPVIWVLVNSLKLTPDIIRMPPEWIPWPITGEHYWQVLFSADRSARIGRSFLNSAIVSVGSVGLVLVTSAMAAYPLARMRFPGRNLIFAVLVGSLMVPNVVTLVPQYILVQRLGWLSTFQGLIVPEAATILAFGVFLLRQFFLAIPTELEDAARIDGANAWQIFTRVILPLSHPAFAALSIFAFRSAWNDFLWPLIAVNKPDMFPLPVALALLRGAYMNESYGPIMAGAVLSALPLLIVFLLANRRIVEGVQLSGLKG
jgi:multiple sugar transport system permease protein